MSLINSFYAASDNGVRLWIDDKLVIDDWNNVAVERTGSIQLMKGFYPIKLEYFDGVGRGAIRLYWSSTSISKSIILSDNFYESWYTYPLNAYPVKIKLLGSEYQIDPSSLKVYYKINDITMWNSIPLSSTGVDYEYLALIPQQIAGTRVYYYIEGKDLAGNIITSPTERPRLTPYKFKVVALSIISTTPKDKAINVSVASNIKIVFSDSIDPATIGTNTIKVMVGTFTVDGVYSYNNANKTVTFEPTGGLKEKTNYTVIITTKVMDTASNTIPIEYAFSFWTDLLGNLDEYTRVDGRDLVCPEIRDT